MRPSRRARYLLLLIASLLVAWGTQRAAGRTAPQSSLADSLARANRLYEAQRFREARDLYRRLLARADTPSALRGPLHFNLGTTEARLGALGEGILHLERARHYLGNVPEIIRNLEIARSRIETPVAELPRPFWGRWSESVVDAIGSRGLFYAGVGAYLVALLLAGLALIRSETRGERSRWLPLLATISLLIALVGAVGGLWSSYERAAESGGVVLVESAALRADPDAAAAADRRISEGVRVEIRERDGVWMRVRLPDGQEGWIRAEEVSAI